MADIDPVAAQIAAEYPDLSETDQAKAVEISTASAALRKLAMDADSFPQKMSRVSFRQQIDQLRLSMLSALAMK